jgi:PAS domain S-box-containing protein
MAVLPRHTNLLIPSAFSPAPTSPFADCRVRDQRNFNELHKNNIAHFRKPDELHTASDSHTQRAHNALREIREAHSPVSALTVLGPSQDRVIAHSSDIASHPEKIHHQQKTDFTGQAIHLPGENGAHAVLVPIDWGEDQPAGFVRAEGNTATQPLGTAFFTVLSPVLAIAAIIAAFVGFLVFNASARFHKAYGQLANAEKRLRDIADAAGEYIWEVDASGKFTFLSARVTEVLGYKPEELIGRHPFKLLDPSQSNEVASKSRNIANSAKPFRDFEHRMIRKDKRPIWVSINGVPVLDSSGCLVGYTGATLDITARKTGEEALIREKEAAQAATLAKSQFLAMMSHEIRTPLNSVLGFTELLSTSELTLSQREQVDMIRKNGEGLLLLLSDILEFSQSDTYSPVPRPKSTDLANFLREIFDIHTGPAEAKGIKIETHFAPQVPQAVKLDQPRVRQILINLIGNAVKFTEKGFVTIDVGASRDQTPGSSTFPLRISISDSGPGIPENKRPGLFQPFSQGDPTPTRRFGGTGLGLAICEKLATLLNAKVHLSQTSPSGSTFIFEMDCEIAATQKKSHDFH